MLVSQSMDPAHPYEAVFTLNTPAPLYLWVSACTEPKCPCRAALAVLTDAGPEAAQRHGAQARDAHHKGSVEVAARIGGLLHFFLGFDSASLYWHTSGQWMEISGDERLEPIVPHVTGELLDEVARLWRRARGQEENPEQALLQKDSLRLEHWTPGTLLAWDSLDLYLRLDMYEYDHQKRRYRVMEYYCSNPQCSCGKASTSWSCAGGPWS